MSEQQAASACPNPEAVGTRWGDPISEEQVAEAKGWGKLLLTGHCAYGFQVAMPRSPPE